ncbi:ComEC/Rec2 family competence protein [Konateibacter massiliensis]|uniref:ComEC/Rec2 family competence protein n=1 Tax=Konateibacter massiliensis TaxID=2002841 RepID=UPI000C14A987|nr:MBL fold metallo-hydrolase [Konateibacter massiliensis]
MKDRTKKIIVLEIVVLVALLFLWGISHFGKNSGESMGSTQEGALELPTMTVTFLDVGKGDCMVIETSEGAVMIDTGYDEDGEDIVNWLTEKGIDNLSHLILTHPDKDHIGGADTIIDEIGVGQIIETDCVVDSDDYTEYKEAAQDRGVTILTLKDTKEITLGSAVFTIYPPISTDFTGENDYSLVTKLVYGATDFLFAGDSEEGRIDEVMQQIPNLKSMVLKVPHHGNLKDNSEEFFKKVSPKYSIITNNSKKAYEDVTKILQNLNSQVYTTKQGAITVQSDGINLSISQ